MLLVARSVAVALSFVLLSSPPLLQHWVGGDTRAYVAATIALAIVNVLLVLSWSEPVCRAALSGPPYIIFAAAVAVGAGWLLFTACRVWLHQILTIPHDPQRADMLIVVQQGLQRMFQGRNPYTIYHLPWDAPLPYGPLLWGPYAIPLALHADVRFLTVAGELFVPVACAMAAAVSAARGRLAACAGCLLMLAAMCLNPDLERFASIGHTPVYWPLLALFAWLVTRERWFASAIALGLLVAARTTMVAMVPVLLMAVWWRERTRLPGVLVLVTLAAAVPFLPFAIWDPRALSYALYGSYENVIKGFVWSSTTWAQHTIGLTGVLLSAGLPRVVEPFQWIFMLAIYVACWQLLRRRRSPVASMGLALLAFSMTTLWPVTYVYFDVFLLFAAAVIADAARSEADQRPRLARWKTWSTLTTSWTATAAVTLLLVVGHAALMLPDNPVVDAGTASARPLLRSGFGDDESDGARTFAWVEGRHASVLLPRRTARDAVVDLDCQPALSTAASVQQMSAVLNGELVRTTVLPAGWNRVSLVAPAHAWRIGVNELELFLSSSESPRGAGPGGDGRSLSVAVDRVTVRPVP